MPNRLERRRSNSQERPTGHSHKERLRSAIATISSRRLTRSNINRSCRVGPRRCEAAQQGIGLVEAGGAALRFAGALGLGVGAIAGFVSATVKATDAQIQSMARFGESSASMAMVMAQREVREINRQRQMGEELAPGAERLTKYEQERKDATKPIEVLWETAVNKILSRANDILAQALTPIGEICQQILDALPDDPFKDTSTGTGASYVAWRTQQHHEARTDLGDPWFHRPGPH